MMVYYLMILFCIIILIDCQQIDEIVECQNKDLTQYQLDKMNLNDQEKLKNNLFLISNVHIQRLKRNTFKILANRILKEYDKNLTTLAYITASAEFESTLYQNDTNKKRTTEKYYEIYRGCLKTIAIVGKQFKNLIHHQNSSIRWLLLRTQAIGEAGENNTIMKAELQKLRTCIKEVYHRKFIWNHTKIGIDEVQEILGKLRSPNDLLSLWNATYEVAAPMRDHYSTLIAIQNQQAKQNRTSAVTHSHI